MTATDGHEGPTRPMRLRFAGRCRDCSRELPAGELASYHSETKSVVCARCEPQIAAAIPADSTDSPANAPDPEIFTGVAGASARREYERRKLGRETRIRTNHPVIGGVLLALSDDPQSTTAWDKGARGEERLGHRLDKLVSETVHVLHDRRIPGSRANIDHIAVGPSGVFVIDAKKYTGRPSLKVEGGLFRRQAKLVVGSRDQTKLVLGAQKQVGLVKDALRSAQLGEVPVEGMLCFVDADWPLIGGDFTIDGVRVLWPKRAAGYVTQNGGIDAATTRLIHQAIAGVFPPA